MTITFLLPYILLFFVLIIQIIAIWRNKSVSKIRLSIRTSLNLLLWFALLFFVISPKWGESTSDNKILLVAENVPSTIVQKMKDSLLIKQIFDERKILKLAEENPNFQENVFVLGQKFSPYVLSKLYNKKNTWIAYFEIDKLQKIAWSGVIRKGEIQKISGDIESSKTQLLKIKYGSITLDSITLEKGLNHFELDFPVFGLGRNLMTLLLGDETLQHIHFFSQAAQPISVQFILENPDFEAKMLAEWLGKQGNQVEITTKTTKNTVSQTSINKQKYFEPDLIITTPANADNPNTKKILIAGKSVLFIGLSNPEEDVKNLPLHIGLRRTTNDENIKITEDLTAQPFTFITKPKQKILMDYPVLVQKANEKIAISLLNETFPLKLSGDTLAYSKVWGSILQQLQPDFKDNVRIDAPILQNLQTKIRFNNLSKEDKGVKIATDTLQKQQSAINFASSEINHVFRQTDWQPLADSMEVFVEPSTINNNQLANLPSTKSNYPLSIIHYSSNEWFWFFLILFFLAALWIEPKL